jgi:DNA-binding CsgD family transcriptional regulator
VRALVIFGGFVRGLFHQGVSERTRLAGQEMLRLAELGWSGNSRSFRQLFSARMLVDVPEEVRAEYDECYKHSVTGPMAARCLQAFYEIDARSDAAQVTCPTLVMHVTGDQMILQREVLAQVARGLTDKEIAQRLSLSPRTVEMHVAGAIERLGCRNRSEAVSRAHAWKLIS